MTTSERAVRKAGRERLLRDFARAARIVRIMARRPDSTPEPDGGRSLVLVTAANQTSRTRYACLMTAFGQ